MVGHVVIGKDRDTGIFVATNATFPQSVSNGTLSVGVSDSVDCNSDAHGRAPKFQFDDPVTYNIDELGMIEGENGWFKQSIRELQSNSTLPISLADLINGMADVVTGLATLFNVDTSQSQYGLAVYLLSSDGELLGCASMERLDDPYKALEYYASFNGMLGQDQEAAKEAPSSGSKIGPLMSVFAITAVGIVFVMGNVFAL